MAARPLPAGPTLFTVIVDLARAGGLARLYRRPDLAAGAEQSSARGGRIAPVL